jgi:hypothetical protein
MPDGTAPRVPLKYYASFVRARPGDLLLHPLTGEPICVVVTAENTTLERAGKPNRYTITLTLEDLP